jgi:DNA (cytosine-5)-methyltransferase 1
MGLAEPFLVPNFGERKGQSPRCHSVNSPLPAVTSHGAGGVVHPFLVKYHGADEQAHSVDEPLGTITARDRFALVSPEFVHKVEGEVVGWLDIRFRMLQPKELAAAMSFPDGYKFEGSREAQVKQIGNAVPVKLATALCKEILS